MSKKSLEGQKIAPREKSPETIATLQEFAVCKKHGIRFFYCYQSSEPWFNGPAWYHCPYICPEIEELGTLRSLIHYGGETKAEAIRAAYELLTEQNLAVH